MHRNNHVTIFVLLSLMAATNVSQAMVLCIGCDGHMAIEPAGHDHCADGTHLCEADAAARDARLVPGADATRCGGCTDLSMADEIGSDPAASAASKSLSAGMLATSSLLLTPLNHATCAAPSASAFLTLYPVPLNHIVLQV